MVKKRSEQFNSYVLPVIRYPAGIISWPKEKIQTTDIKTQQLLNVYGGGDRINLITENRGLVSIRAEGTIVRGKTHLWDASSRDSWSGAKDQILPMNGRSEGQHRSTDHVSTAAVLEQQSYRGLDSLH